MHGSLSYLPVTTVFAVIILGSIYFLYGSATSELAPEEDQGVIITVCHRRREFNAAAASAV